jgi:hypothetical protein
MVITLLTATAFAQRPDHFAVGGAVHAICWIAQFLGHGVAEKRAPALLDNLLGGKMNAMSYKSVCFNCFESCCSCAIFRASGGPFHARISPRHAQTTQK